MSFRMWPRASAPEFRLTQDENAILARLIAVGGW
jgi:hypothetical protein